MQAWNVTRRRFLQVAAALGLTQTLGCGFFGLPDDDTDGGSKPAGNGVVVNRRSGRSGHISNAAKKHNANHLYRTPEAAANDPAHPGDNSKVVQVTISAELFEELFGDGQLSADLRINH